MDLGGVAVYAGYSRKTELANVFEILQQAGFYRAKIGLRLASTHPWAVLLKDTANHSQPERDRNNIWFDGIDIVYASEGTGMETASVLPRKLLRHSALLFLRCRDAAESEWVRQILLHTGATEVVCLEEIFLSNRKMDATAKGFPGLDAARNGKPIPPPGS
jgi:hypothetical protein